MAETLVVMVTGSSGFIGSPLVNKLAMKHEVICVDRSSRVNNKRCTFIKGDITNSKVFETIPQRVDYVFDFGSPASMRLFDRNPSQVTSDTIRGIINVLEFCKNKGVTKLIYPSSGTVYGNSIGSDEKNVKPMNHYAAVKAFYESISQVYSNYFPSTGLRIFMGYGPGEERKDEIGSPAYLFLRDIMAGKQPRIWGNGLQQRDLVYIDDIVDVAINCMTTETEKFFDVGTGKSLNFIQLLEVISKITNIDLRPVFVDAPQGYQTITRSDPIQFIQLLGRDPIPAEIGIQKFYNYLREKRI